MLRRSLYFRGRRDLVEWMDEPCPPEVMEACLRDIARVNLWTRGHLPLLHWLETIAAPLHQPIRILDVGCGYGDLLRRIEMWAVRRNLAVELTGLERNENALQSAYRASSPGSRIAWVHGDIFGYAPHQPFHLVVSSLFTHHLDQQSIVMFLQWMEENALDGWFISDLYRSRHVYHFFRLLAKAARMHPYVQHDGPVSIQRSFVPADWQALCAEAGLTRNDVQIRSFGFASRLCVLRSKSH